MIKAGRGVILVLLCVVFIFCQTGCTRNKESSKVENNNATVVSSAPTVSALPSPEPVKAGIDISYIEGISEEFIFGVNISDIKSEYDCGVRYFDFDGKKLFYAPEEGQKGFFTFLKECGLNWVRIYSSYDTDDLESVKEAGKLASDAGLKVLIEFCYPDLSTSTGSCLEPEGWQDMGIEEKTETLKEYTVENLTQLIDYGVDVCMVQISSEYAVDMDLANICILINSGSNAVRYVADTMEKEILVAVHFTDASESQYETVAAALEDNQTDYDIFVASYYTHMDNAAQNFTQNFTQVIKAIAEKYCKEVILIADSDVCKIKGKKAAQRQADIVTDMIQSIVNIGEAGTGVFLETALFDSKGHPLKSANVFTYVFTGAVKK